MKSQYQAEIRLLSLTLSFSLLLGLAVGHPVPALLFGLIGHMAWNFRRIRSLDTWLTTEGKGDKPKLDGVYGYIVDRVIRLRRQSELEIQVLRSSIDRQNQLIADVKDAVILVDEYNRLKWFNRAAESLFHLDPDKDLSVPIKGALRQASFHSYFDAGDFSKPKRFCFDDSAKHWLEITISAYDNGEKLLIIRDVSALQELEEMRRDFIANLSHELRTPVTVLVGYLETLELQDAQNPSVARIHGEMAKQCDRISALLKDLLTLSRLEAMDSERPVGVVEISSLLERIAIDATRIKEFDQHKIITKIEPGLKVVSSENDMLSAFTNLVYNAVRHTPPGTEITIRAKSKQGMARVEIIDKGFGIEQKHLHRLTERFYRVESSRNSETGGTGLGLAIVKHALMRSGGKLKIESQLGKGSSFRCLLPLAVEQVAPSEARGTRKASK